MPTDGAPSSFPAMQTSIYGERGNERANEESGGGMDLRRRRRRGGGASDANIARALTGQREEITQIRLLLSRKETR